MISNIERLIPELRVDSVREIVRNNLLLANMTEENQRDLIRIVLGKFALFYNYEYFDLTSREAEYTHIPAWIGALSDLTTRQLFGGLLLCLGGKTRYIDKPPPNVIAFHAVCLEAEFPKDYFKPLLGIEHNSKGDSFVDDKREEREQMVSNYLQKVRDMLGQRGDCA